MWLQSHGKMKRNRKKHSSGSTSLQSYGNSQNGKYLKFILHFYTLFPQSQKKSSNFYSSTLYWTDIAFIVTCFQLSPIPNVPFPQTIKLKVPELITCNLKACVLPSCNQLSDLLWTEWFEDDFISPFYFIKTDLSR